MREELDEHLHAINENTEEIQSNYAYVQKLDAKLEQVMARLNHIELLLEGQSQKPAVQPLTLAEKQVFLVLYTEEIPLTYAGIAERTGYAECVVQQYLSNLVGKGIPIIKSHLNGTPLIKVAPQFKEMQAKENLINLSLKSFVEN
jgi:hypothetical protein